MLSGDLRDMRLAFKYGLENDALGPDAIRIAIDRLEELARRAEALERLTVPAQARFVPQVVATWPAGDPGARRPDGGAA